MRATAAHAPTRRRRRDIRRPRGAAAGKRRRTSRGPRRVRVGGHMFKLPAGRRRGDGERAVGGGSRRVGAPAGAARQMTCRDHGGGRAPPRKTAGGDPRTVVCGAGPSNPWEKCPLTDESPSIVALPRLPDGSVEYDVASQPALEFPSCVPVRLTRVEYEASEGRLALWDARTETGWTVREPIGAAHEQPGHALPALGRLARCVSRMSAICPGYGAYRNGCGGWHCPGRYPELDPSSLRVISAARSARFGCWRMASSKWASTSRPSSASLR